MRLLHDRAKEIFHTKRSHFFDIDPCRAVDITLRFQVHTFPMTHIATHSTVEHDSPMIDATATNTKSFRIIPLPFQKRSSLSNDEVNREGKVFLIYDAFCFLAFSPEKSEFPFECWHGELHKGTKTFSEVIHPDKAEKNRNAGRMIADDSWKISSDLPLKLNAPCASNCRKTNANHFYSFRLRIGVEKRL